MFVFDQLRRNGNQIYVVSMVIALGMLILLAGLWYVQVVSAKRFEKSLQKQSIRSVRLPGIRGKILDCQGRILAENRASYSIDVYLKDVLAPFEQTNTVLRDYRKYYAGKLTSTQMLSNVRLIKQNTRFQIISNLAANTAVTLKATPNLNQKDFLKHLDEWKYVPYPLFKRLETNSPNQLALFSEQLSAEPFMDLNMRAMRYYPNSYCAAHLLGYVQSQNWVDDEEEDISFCLPFWKGKMGLEKYFETYLEGSPGIKRVVVDRNNYLQREETIPPEPGDDIYLTLNMDIQRAAESALGNVMPGTRGAAIVMDVRSGDILAMASSPTYNPNIWTSPVSHEDYMRLGDAHFRPMFNRAMAGSYHPGSIFKIITSIAILEEGLDPAENYSSLGFYPLTSPPNRKKSIGDTAGPGDFDFDKAFYKSSNPYFCYYGSRVGVRKLMEVAERFHLGESTELGVGSEASGYMPKPDKVPRDWTRTDAAMVSIGQIITITPLQIAGMISSIANGGTLYWPRLVTYRKSAKTGEVEQLAPPARVRCLVAIQPRHLQLIRNAMVADTENSQGTAHKAFFSPPSSVLTGANFRVAGKTGTAQRTEKGIKDYVTWFASYGPFESPRYAVIVMVEGGSSGGTSCAPVARKIYEALVKSETSPQTPQQTHVIAKN